MKRVIEKCWRDSSSLMVFSRRERVPSGGKSGSGNYDVLLQTRSSTASFPSSAVFPGGVYEEADGGDRWRSLFASFGYQDSDFRTLHAAGSPVSPIFRDDPVKRHIALRITAIRETFEELGLLICSSEHKNNRSNQLASIVSDVDTKYWRSRVSQDPGELFNLCKEHKCYPDIWSLYYWSNWLTPTNRPRRFDTAFFVTALDDKPNIKSNSEVVKVQWSSPSEILEENNNGDIILQPPQQYELSRIGHISDFEQLIKFAKERSPYGNELFYPVFMQAKNGLLCLFPGDCLYPSDRVDYNRKDPFTIDKTLEETREGALHRFEAVDSKTFFVINNYTPYHHINMGNNVMQLNSREIRV